MPVDSYASVTVILPAQNEEKSLPLVLGDLPHVGRVIVVDNDSSDCTAEVARQAGAEVVTERRRGYGAACLAGIAALASAPPEVVVFLDADFSDHPEELPTLVDPILAGDYDFVLGSRLMGNRERGAMPPQGVWGNRLACFLMWLRFRVHYTDLGPFRAIGYQQLQSLGMVDENFGWTIEMQIKATQAGLRIKEVPVSYRRRIGVSKISGTISGTFRAGTKILWTVARYGCFPPTRTGSSQHD